MSNNITIDPTRAKCELQFDHNHENEADQLQNITANNARFGVHVGATIVAKSWSDPEFAKRLRDNATEAIKSIGYHVPTSHSDGSEELVTVENTDQVHNLVVCVMCSCYPKSILGLPPNWYKSESYRHRAVTEPRELLKEFELDVNDKTVQVWDSIAERRYMVIPQRPKNTEHLTEHQLAELVTRDSLIGTEILTYNRADAGIHC